MLNRRTEQLHEAAEGLDALPLPETAALLIRSQQDALQAVAPVAGALADGGALMADVIRNGGRIHYVAAGSSGLMALADACELAGTFGTDPGQIGIHMAGGIPRDATMPGDTEDDARAARDIAATMGPADVAILLSASGSTPFALEVASMARQAGAATICIANNPDAPLLDQADVAICLPTPPELLAGSTRMGAGTAQKVALNTMSTIMGIALGHVHDGMMVNVRADNAKLRARAVGMIARIAEVGEEAAHAFLERAGGVVKPAILLAAGAADLNDAMARLSRANGVLRSALKDLTPRPSGRNS